VPEESLFGRAGHCIHFSELRLCAIWVQRIDSKHHHHEAQLPSNPTTSRRSASLALHPAVIGQQPCEW